VALLPHHAYCFAFRSCVLQKGIVLKLIKEFKDFINRGNVMDLAVAVIVGGAFTAIINSFVADLINPFLGILTAGIDFKSIVIPLGDGADAAKLQIGAFIMAVINFLVISLVIFFMVKGVNKISRKKPVEDTPMKDCPYCKESIPDAAVRCPSCTTILDAEAVPEQIR
jgi:large conductance mechanosensitive channel